MAIDYDRMNKRWPIRKRALAKAYPEHTKLMALNGANQNVGEFLEWLFSEDYLICERSGPQSELVPVIRSIDSWLAQYFGINPAALEEEKRRMLRAVDDLREGHRA